MSNSMDHEMLILSNSTKIGRNSESETEIEDNKDRLSDLPDCILLHILSFLKAKHAVQTCILATRWKNLWKLVPTLTLHSSDFSTFKGFTEFVSTILNLRRDGSTALHGLDFECVNRLGFNVGRNNDMLPCIFTCQSLTSLKLSLDPEACKSQRNLFPESLNLPALTTLHLRSFTFCSSDPFSAFNRLNTLIIDCCNLKDAGTLCISSATLVNLTVQDIRMLICEIELSTPCLHRFSFKGYSEQHPCGVGLSSVQEVYIDVDICSSSNVCPLILLSWLRDLVNIRSLTVSTNTLQVLSLVPYILNMKPLLWVNLKRLKIKREPLSYMLILVKVKATESPEEADMLWKTSWERTPPLPDGIVDFLLQNSPSAEVETID